MEWPGRGAVLRRTLGGRKRRLTTPMANKTQHVDTATRKVTIRIPQDLLEDIDAACEANGFMNRSEYIRQALRESQITG